MIKDLERLLVPVLTDLSTANIAGYDPNLSDASNVDILMNISEKVMMPVKKEFMAILGPNKTVFGGENAMPALAKMFTGIMASDESLAGIKTYNSYAQNTLQNSIDGTLLMFFALNGDYVETSLNPLTSAGGKAVMTYDDIWTMMTGYLEIAKLNVSIDKQKAYDLIWGADGLVNKMMTMMNGLEQLKTIVFTNPTAVLEQFEVTNAEATALNLEFGDLEDLLPQIIALMPIIKKLTM